MTKKPLPIVEAKLDTIVGGGQTLGTLPSGKKLFTWGGLPGERVNVQITKKKANLAEGIVTEVLEPSPQRVEPRDSASYLSTSPWQIMDFDAEQHYKSALIEEAFELHDIVLPQPITVYSDGVQYEYRNKIEFSFWYDTDEQQLDLAFYRRGTHGKIAIDHTSLASPAITDASRAILRTLNIQKIEGRALKTLMIRSNRAGQVAWQLYVKDEKFDAQAILDAVSLPSIICGEIIYSNPQSPASVITKRLAATSDTVLTDTILDVPFSYATEGFFQINLPVYEQALRDMKVWVDNATPSGDAARAAVGGAANLDSAEQRVAASGAAPTFTDAKGGLKVGADSPTGPASAKEKDHNDWILNQVQDDRGESHSDNLSSTDLPPPTPSGVAQEGDGMVGGNGERGSNRPVVDLYSGVGTIGLTIGGLDVTLVEINEHAVREMQRNIHSLNRKQQAKAILAPSENALDHITPDSTIIVDPPRAGLHEDVIAKLLAAAPPRIIYLSCNPVTQARDIMRLADRYGIRYHQGYNFFPRTPHIEHLAVLDLKG